MGNIIEDINLIGGGNQQDNQGSELQLHQIQKDPRTIARKYQTELCQKALQENIIAYLETGCGKTHIAILLIYEMRCRMIDPKKDICIFLAPTVALVEQQAKVIEDSLDVKVGIFCGSSKMKGHHDWEKALEQFEVLVMTPQILLHNLSHCCIKIEQIALLIFDECHYAQLESNHPYAEIMKIFYKPGLAKLPRIFGMTASPVFGKGASLESLQSLLHAKVEPGSREELDQYVSSPKFNVYYYGTSTNSFLETYGIYCRKLETIKLECMPELLKNIEDHTVSQNTKKALNRRHGSIEFCLENLGLWGALQACQISLKGDLFEQNAVFEEEEQCDSYDDVLCGNYLSSVSNYFASVCKIANGTEADLSCFDTLGVPFISLKLLRLVDVLSNFRAQPDMKCIIFVNRIITARTLARVLKQLRILSAWRCSYLVGVHSSVKSMSRKTTNAILEKFRSGELNLLVATRVGEEGLDIQTCCLVIRFDLPETVASYIQSRGRARMPQSEYAFLVNRANDKELKLVENFQKEETQMNNEISSRTSTVECVEFKEKTYKVDSTGAIISSTSSVSLLHRYCSKLPHDEFFNPKPRLYYTNHDEGIFCSIVLPANAPIHEILGLPQPSMEEAKKDACLRACQQLHELGALTHYLLPDDEVDDENQDFSDSDSDDEENSRRELHEMRVPSALREPWIKEEHKKFVLNSYFIKFTPSPADRDYQDFGLFIKARIPQEAEKMKLDLHLARGRSVLTEIVPCGVSEFIDNEIVLAEKFQEMWLKAIIDKSELTMDYVRLGKDDVSNIASTFYLLLPVIVNEHQKSISVDWNLITKCLSSPIFKNPEDIVQTSYMNNCLHLANGPTQINDILHSFVYVPCKDTFFFVSEFLPDRNSFSVFKDDKSYINHFAEVFQIILLHPNQPLLKVKQLFRLDNLLRKRGSSEPREKEEHFVELPPEMCVLKIIGFSKEIGSALSLLPSVIHRLESFLVAIELRHRLSASFSEGSEVSVDRILEALTTERCNERFSLERLEVLGDAFLKFAVGRHLFLLNHALDEGQLTRKRSNMVNNSHLFKLAVFNNLHVYIRDQPFEPSHFYPFGRRCSVICNDNTRLNIHSSHESNLKTGANMEVRCNKGHHWLQKKTVADIVEALVGAFIVDSGFKAAIAFLKWIGIPVDFKDSHVANMCASSTDFISLSAQIDIPTLEGLLGYQFQHKGLLLQAFLHPSYHNNCGGCYQRLEFLGDAVLDYLITSYLYSVYPNLKPGQLTDLRSLSVNNNSFAGIAVNRSFYKFMLCDSSNLIQSMNKYAEFFKTCSSKDGLVETVPCPKALGDLVESCVGAILLDSGFNLDLVWKIMISFLDPVMKFSALQLNPIRELQELCQFYNWELTFPSVKKDKTFTVEAIVDGKEVCESACASNFNKKTAKRIACQKLYLSLKEKGYKTKMKSLEEVLEVSQKMEAKLIGYDETPTDVVVSLANQLKDVNATELRSVSRKAHAGSENSIQSCSGVRRMVQPMPECSSSNGSANSNLQAPAGDALRKSSAKSHLYEICAVNCWKPPLFECFDEIGPAHLKQFAFRVSMTIEEASNTVLECIGDHRAKKKDAAEFAAHGLIWYLKQNGYLQK
ncbi:dicer-like protein 4 isoform X2 [Rutidosis leptorrhynchoides]|uniref:dicer-like protein 4 isoform X2 n=1 Tax=Rutidosis leptorrhynchoides TaxID=125765 RepID=UPI003A9A35BD